MFANTLEIVKESCSTINEADRWSFKESDKIQFQNSNLKFNKVKEKQ